MRQGSLPFVSLLLLILTFFILQSNALASYPVTIFSSGMINYNPTPEDGWLHTDGIYIKDSAGRTVAWRGIIFEYQSVTQNVIDVAKAHGATYIELGFVPDRPSVEWYLDVNSETHLGRLDNIISMCEASGIYVVLCCLDGSTNRINAGLATSWEDVVPIDAFETLVQRYSNRPVVCGVKFLDEPNFSQNEERQMYLNAIDALKPLSPSLLWVCHLIIYHRFSHAGLNPWWNGIPTGYSNIIMDAGAWLGHLDNPYPANFEETDYETADVFVDDVIDKISTFQDRIPMPCGMAYGTEEVGMDNAYTYAMRELHRKMEINRMYPTYLLSSYMIDQPGEMQDVCDRIMPDAPYPQYW
jgi:hypothetical protein